MEFEKVLVKRVLTRRYNDKMPSDEMIQKVVDAALLAPIVHFNKFHLSVVTNKDSMNLAEDAADVIFQSPDAQIKMPRPYMYNAPVVVAMRGRPDVRKALGIPEGYTALASVIIGYTDAEIPERKVKPEFIPVSYVR